MADSNADDADMPLPEYNFSVFNFANLFPPPLLLSIPDSDEEELELPPVMGDTSEEEVEQDEEDSSEDMFGTSKSQGKEVYMDFEAARKKALESKRKYFFGWIGKIFLWFSVGNVPSKKKQLFLRLWLSLFLLLRKKTEAFLSHNVARKSTFSYKESVSLTFYNRAHTSARESVSAQHPIDFDECFFMD